MKKIICSFVVLLMLIFSIQNAFAVIIAPTTNDIITPDPIEIDNKINDRKYLVQFDGKDYVIGLGSGKTLYRQTEYNEEEQRHFWNMDYIRAGEYYLARDLREAGVPQWKAVPLLIYDNQFNLVKEQYFSNGYGIVVDMSYVNGKYYCIYSELFQILENEDGTQSYQTFGEGFDEKYAKMTYNSWPYSLKTTTFVSVAESNNGLDWTTVAARLPVNGYQNLIPRSNGEIAIARQKTAVGHTGFKTILYEDETKNSPTPDFINDYKYVDALENWFFMYDGGSENSLQEKEKSFYLTKDNVYFVKIIARDEKTVVTASDPPVKIYEHGDYIYVIFKRSSSHGLKIPKSEVYAELERLKTAPYVQVNDKILGFETPPITEDDRTLVPMRFLFEQLGAEVSWDETTNTATATIPPEKDEKLRTAASAKSISFSIDNTAATVNGVTATMDVPARLVDDKTMVPLRFLSENLGYTVTWNEETKTASIIEPSEFSVDKTEHPELSGTTQKHYVVYQEGHREGRIEFALFDIADNSAQSLVNREGALELSDNSKYQNDSKWYWQEGKWIPFEEGYERISNNAVSVISSDVPVVE